MKKQDGRVTYHARYLEMKKSRFDKAFDREIRLDEFRVTVFGSARVKKGDKTYKLVHSLAKHIGAQGFDVVTGGGPGLMDAASSGHAAGVKKGNQTAHALGLLIKLYVKERPNTHLNLKKEFSRFSERLDYFMSLSNVVVVAPGGLGTLLELFYTWQLIQVKQTCNIPIILLGDHYDELITWIRKGPVAHRYMDARDLDMIATARNPDEAMKIIMETYAQYKRGGNDVCINLKRYRVQ